MSPRLTQDQLDERLQGIGASEMPAIAGVDQYRTALEVYLIKIGELDPEALIDEASRGRMERGHRLEDVALEWDRDANGGERFERVHKTVWHPRLGFLYCHPDARRIPWTKTRRLIEVKTSARKWTELPRSVEVQVQMQMACTGALACDVVLLTFDGAPERFEVKRDEDLIVALLDVATSFWDRVNRLDPPPMDGGAGTTHWLNTTRWKNEPEFRANADQTEVIRQLLDVKRKLATYEAEEDRLANVLKFSMAGAGRMLAPGVGRVIWTAPTKVRTVKWKEVASDYRQLAEHLAPDPFGILADLEAIEIKNTHEREQRTFTVRESED